MAFDFIAGCLGGLAGVVVGHPFDTVKVQGLFKGMASPLAGLGLINAIIFGVQGETVRRFKLTGWKGECIAGTLAGAIQSFVCCPMELAKTRVQVQGMNTKFNHIFFHSLQERHVLKYHGSFDCIRKVYKAEGLHGCFRGMSLTFLRDTPAFSLYFGSFYLLCDWLTPEGSSIHSLGPMRLLMAGGLGGTLSWVLTYPIDVIKSRYQADGVGPKPNYKGILDCVKQTYAAEGLAGFSRGMLATILRAFPVNATTLTVVTIVLRFGRDLHEPQLEIA